MDPEDSSRLVEVKPEPALPEKSKGKVAGVFKVLGLYFFLYLSAVLITCLSITHSLLPFFLILVWFPLGLLFPLSLWGADNRIPLLLGYLVYLGLLIAVIKCRTSKKWIVLAFVVFILLLILNMYGCHVIDNDGRIYEGIP